MLSIKDKLSIYKKLQLLQDNYKDTVINFCQNFSNFEEILKNFNKLNDATLYEIKLFVDNLNLDNSDTTISTNNMFKNGFYKKDKTKVINLLASIYKLFIINTSYINKETLYVENIVKKNKKRKKLKQEESSSSTLETIDNDIDSDSVLEYLIHCYKYDEVQENNKHGSGFYNMSENEQDTDTDTDTDTCESIIYTSSSDTYPKEESDKDDSSSLYSFGSDVYDRIMADF